MILPIYAYGQAVLKKLGQEITSEYEDLDKLIEDMWDTMYNASGVGLAAPQIGKPIRVFIIDSTQMMEEGFESDGVKAVFINPIIIEETGDIWSFEEGCLSIPNVTGSVERPENITLKYFDQNFQEHTATFDGINARVIQHEYDHIEGTLFTEKLKPVKKRLISRKLNAIKKGNINAKYRMKFVKK